MVHKCGEYTQVRISPGDQYVKSFKSKAQAEQVAELMAEYMNNRGFTLAKAKQAAIGTALGTYEEEASKVKAQKNMDKEAQKLKGKVRNKQFKKERRYAGEILQSKRRFQVRVNPGQKYVHYFDDKKEAIRAVNILEECLNEKGYSFERAKQAASRNGVVEREAKAVVGVSNMAEYTYYQLHVNPGKRFVKNFRIRREADRAKKLIEDYINIHCYSFEEAKRDTIQNLEDEDKPSENHTEIRAAVAKVKIRKNTYFRVFVNPGKQFVKNFRTQGHANRARELIENYMNKQGYSFKQAKLSTIQEIENGEDTQENDKISASVYELKQEGYFQVMVNPGQLYVKKFKSKAKAQWAAKLMEEYMNDRGYNLKEAKQNALSVIEAEDHFTDGTDKKEERNVVDRATENIEKEGPKIDKKVHALVYKVRLEDHDYFQVNVLRQNVQKFRTESQAYRVANLMEEYMNTRQYDFEKAKREVLSSVEELKPEVDFENAMEYKGCMYRQRAGFQVRVKPGSQYVSLFADEETATRAVELIQDYMNKRGYDFEKAKHCTLAIMEKEKASKNIESSDKEEKEKCKISYWSLGNGRYQIRVNSRYVKNCKTKACSIKAVKIMDEYINGRGYSFERAKEALLGVTKTSADSVETNDEDDDEQKPEAAVAVREGKDQVQVQLQKQGDGRSLVFVNPGRRYVKQFSDRARAEEAVKLMDEYMNRRGYTFTKAKTEVISSI